MTTGPPEKLIRRQRELLIVRHPTRPAQVNGHTAGRLICHGTAGGIREHACIILDGGEVAFQKRKDKYKIR